MPLVLDTDIGSDVDDALALAFALRHPDIDLVAVTTVADDVRLRAHIAHKLLQIAGRSDVEVAPGVGWKRSPSKRPSAWSHEGRGLLDPDETRPRFARDGVTLLVDETKHKALEVATIGMQSNIAAALDRDDDLARRVAHLHVMGGVFAPIRAHGRERPPSSDHNLVVDPTASVRALNAGIPTTYVPLDVTVHAPLPRALLEELRGGDDLCRALARLVDVWIEVSRPPDDVAAIMHDPLTVACTVDRRCVTVERLPVTVAIHDGVVRTFIDPVEGAEAEVVTSVDGASFANFWLETVLAS